MTHSPLRIGTRGSALALAQAHLVRDLLLQHHPHFTADALEITILKTTGDQVQDRPLSEIGGKGLFTKELEDALLDGRIHLAVHSMKDVPTRLPDGLSLPCILEREDARDAFISLHHATLKSLPKGAKVGTSSLRRAAQALNARPDLQIVPFRGNVETRLTKLQNGEVAATFLAVAGLKRLGFEHRITQSLPEKLMLPAVAQGAIGIQTRTDDNATITLLAPLHHPKTATAVTAERAFLAALNGNCTTPIAAYATLIDDQLALTGLVASPDGKSVQRIRVDGPATEAETIGAAAGKALLKSS